MDSSVRRFWLAATLGSVTMTGWCASLPVTLLTEDFAPYAWQDAGGRVQGISVDLVQELMRRAGVHVAPPRIVPWARALAKAQHEQNTCLFTTARTPDREAVFKWVGPIARLEWVLFARREDQLVLRTLVDARRYRIGTYIADAASTILAGNQLNIERSSSTRANPRKLKLGRIDLWAAGHIPGVKLLSDMGMEGIVPVYSFAQTNMYLACHKSMADTQVAMLSNALRGMYADNTVVRTYAHYGYGSLAPPGPDPLP